MSKSIFKNFIFIFLFTRIISYADTGLSNPSDRAQKSLSNVDLFGTALYWVASETADWGATITLLSQVENIAYQTISFDWSPGLRIGIGYNFQTDSWDTQFSYTNFKVNSRAQASDNIHTAFFGQTISAVGFFQKGTVDWTINYNMFDWDLGRSFFVSKDLSLRPSIGLKGGWIDQKIKTEWSRPELLFTLIAQENLKNNFKGLGPKFGVKSKWNFKNIGIHSLSLVSEASSAFLWGHWKIQDIYKDNFFVTVNTKVKDRAFTALYLQAFLGCGWDFNFDADQSHFALKFGYEIEDWLNQFQVFDDASGANSNDLVLQGPTLNMRFDF